MVRTIARSTLALFLLAAAAAAQQVQYSSAHRDSEQAIPQTVAAATVSDSAVKAKLAATRTGTSLVVADFDSDGTPDLISGYATPAGGILLLQRGSIAAHAPGPQEWAIRAAGQLVPPYKSRAEVIDLPVSPDLLVTADLAGHGNPDLLTAAKGDSTVYVLIGHGDGAFSAPRAVPLAGAISSLTTWRDDKAANLIVAGVCGASGCGLQFLDREGATVAFVRTPAAPLTIQTGRINSGILADLAVVANGRPIVVDGDSVLSGSPVSEKLPLAGAATLALGAFVMDHRGLAQVAVLGTDATLHVFTRAGVQDTPPALGPGPRTHALPLVPPSSAKLTGVAWQEVETVPNVGSGGTPILLRAHLLGSGMDDLAVVAGNQYVTVAHRLSTANGRTVTTPVVTLDSTASPVKAALPARVSSDARQGVLLLGSGPRPLIVSQPGTNHTYTVNTTADGNDTLTSGGRCLGTGTCTLRDAINLSNSNAAANVSAGKVDVINVPAGTYTLSVNNPTKGTTTAATYDNFGSYNYHLEVDGPMVINGAGPGTGAGATIVNANNLDQVFAINAGVYASANADDFHPVIMDAFLTGMTIESGRNPNVYGSGACGSDYCNPYGGGIGWLSEGTTSSNLVLNNVLVTSNQGGAGASGTTGGAGIDASLDTGSGSTTSGPLDIENSTFSFNNDRSGGGGGAIKAEQNAPLVLNNSTVTNNTSANGTTGPGNGGGIQIIPLSGSYTDTAVITNSTITTNTSGAGYGGGVWNNAALTITGTKITNNNAVDFGGGLYTSDATGFPAGNISSSTFTGNALTGTYAGGGLNYTQDGGGVCVEPSFTSGPPTLIFAYNRFHGNTVTSGSAVTGLALGCNSSGTTYSSVNASNNWWGCNGPATGAGCDTAHDGNVTSGTLTLSPYTVLTLGLNNTTISQGSAVVATASLGQNSTGTVYSAAQDTAYLATPISTFTLTNVGTVTYNPSSTALSASAVASSISSAAATATANTAASGTGTATVTVDGATVTKTYTIIPPAILSTTTTNSGPFKQGSTGNTYTITVGNIGSTATSGTVTMNDSLPSGFTATGFSGSGWTCTTSPLSCNRSDSLSSSGTFPALTLTVTVNGTDVGTYTNTATASGGSEVSNGSDVSNNTTYVVVPPTIAQAFNPTTITTGANSTATFTLSNGTGNTVTIAGVAFTDTLPTGLKVANPNGASTTCTSGTVTAAAGGSSIALSGASIAASASCTVSVNVTASIPNSYTNTTGTVTSTTTNPGNTASATLTVADTTTTTVSLGATTGTVGGTTTGSVTVSDTTNPGSYNNGSVKVSNTVNGITTTIGTYTFSGPGTATFTYNESYAGSNVVTAVFTPGDPSLAASADTTGKTIVVAKATPAAPANANDQTVQRNVATVFDFIYSYPGTGSHPTGAMTVTLNGATLSVTPTCTYKNSGAAPHANCAFTYTTTLAAGQYPFTYSVATDANFNAITGTSTVTVLP